MRLLHHRDATHRAPDHDRSPDRTAAPHTADPVAVAVWRGGLHGAVAAGSLVIRAPHASELVDPRAAAKADAA